MHSYLTLDPVHPSYDSPLAELSFGFVLVSEPPHENTVIRLGGVQPNVPTSARARRVENARGR